MIFVKLSEEASSKHFADVVMQSKKFGDHCFIVP